MKNDIKIRDYKNDDYEFIFSLWELVGMAGKERADDTDVILRTINNGGRLIILEKGSLIIGTSWITHDHRRSYIHHFCIHPKEQGKGYGNVLMEATMEILRQIGYQVKLEVHGKNYKAIGLYKKYGFMDFPGYDLMMNRKL